MKTFNLLTISFLFTSICSDIILSQPGWVDWNYSGGTNLSGIHFNDMNTGWAVGQYGTIIKTTDNCLLGFSSILMFQHG